jgi:O-antigen ligase
MDYAMELQRSLRPSTSLMLLLPLTAFFLISLNFYLTWDILKGYAYYDSKRIFEMALLGCMTFTFVLSQSQRVSWLQTFHKIPTLNRVFITGFFLLGLISSLLAPVMKMALLETALYLLFSFFILFIAAQRKQWEQSYDTILLGIVFLSIVSYLAIILKIYAVHLVTNKHIAALYPGFMNPRFFAQYQTWTLSLVLLPIFLYKRKWIKISCWAIALAWWVLAVSNGSKALLLSQLIAFTFSAIYYHRTLLPGVQKKISVIIASVFLVCLTAYGLYHFNIQNAPSKKHTNTSNISNIFKAKNSVDDRLNLWKSAVHFIETKPILGIGPMHFAHDYISPNGFAHNNPHNSLLTITAEWGILAGLLFSILLGSATLTWLKRMPPTPLTIALSSTWIASWCFSLFSGVIITPISQIMLCLIGGWMLGNYHAKTKSQSNSNPKLYQHLLLLILTISACVVIYIAIFPQVMHLSSQEIHWLYSQKMMRFFPRFWLQGRI